MTKKIAIVYHSGYGHTARLVQHIALGAAKNLQLKVDVLSVDNIDWNVLDQADALILGCPTYMGSASAEFKQFMDNSSKVWLAQSWQGKLAAGFTNSGGLSGDKLAVLQQIQLFAMQHGMLWVGMPLQPTGTTPDDLNRMGSYMGLMAQSDNASPDITPPIGDLKTAEWFGNYVAQTVLRLGL
jgi:NAD(P)H dehydrogenase (quinone)